MRATLAPIPVSKMDIETDQGSNSMPFAVNACVQLLLP